MPVVKAKPTSPGRRFVVKVVHPDLHKGAPFKGLVEAKPKSGGRNNKGESPLVTSVVVTSKNTALSISSEILKMASKRLSSGLSMTLTAQRTLRF